jgi:hypothetical protein
MRSIEVFFVSTVLFFAAVFVGMTLSRAGRVIERLTAPEAAGAGVAGEPRDVDLEEIRRLIREGKLSDHEAEYYKKNVRTPDGEGPVPVPVPGTGGEDRDKEGSER